MQLTLPIFLPLLDYRRQDFRGFWGAEFWSSLVGGLPAHREFPPLKALSLKSQRTIVVVWNSKQLSQLGGVPAFNPSTQKQGQENLCKFETCQVYILSSRTEGAT